MFVCIKTGDAPVSYNIVFGGKLMDQAYSRKSEEGLSIDLKEMIWRLLEQWRAILAFVLIIMILFSGLMYVRASGKLIG